jgi:hypothetical protein
LTNPLGFEYLLTINDNVLSAVRISWTYDN